MAAFDSQGFSGSDANERFSIPENKQTFIFAGGGNDYISASGFADLLIGAFGSDFIVGLQGSDTLYGDNPGGGDAGSADFLFGESGSDAIFAGAGRDFVNGGLDQDFIDGGYDNDRIWGGGGSDTILGGLGNDRLYGATEGKALAESLRVRVEVDGITGDPLATPQRFKSLGGERAPNELSDDALDGGAGNDRLFGGRGNDTLTGGTGEDVYVFNTTLNVINNVDTVTDFSVSDDTIVLDRSFFAGLSLGTLAAVHFFRGAAAKDEADRIGYAPATGTLVYDSNGSGVGGDMQFAELAPGLAVTRFDFVVVA